MKWPILAPVIFPCICCAALAQQSSRASSVQTHQTEIRDTYHIVEVAPFDLKPGVEFPVEYLKTLQEEISKQLVSDKIFDSLAQKTEQAGAPVLRLAGNIHSYKKGSQSKRYVGFGMGASEIGARVSLQDAATGQIMVVEELRAYLKGGAFGGKEEHVTNELARQVVEQAKLMVRRRIPPATQTSVSASNTNPGAAEPEHHSLIIDGKKLEDGQLKLDQEAAAGFRVVDVALTGSSTVELDLEKLAAPPEVFQYRWLHMRLYTHLQKEVDKAAMEGFHVYPHSLGWMAPFLMLLVEKPPVVSGIRYQYLVSHPVLMSSAQKDIENHERDGFTLLDESDAGVHILLFEKTGEETRAQEVKK